MIERQDLTFQALVAKMGGACDSILMSLYTMQPNVHAWIDSKKVVLEDCEVMHKFWDIHPLEHFFVENSYGLHSVQIGDILQASLSFEALKGCKVTLDEMAKAGLNPDNMYLFHFSLYQWKQLGFSKHHACIMTSPQIERVFCMTKQVLEASFLENEYHCTEHTAQNGQ